MLPEKPVRPLFFAAAMLAVVMALLPSPPNLMPHVGDKVQHMTAFAVLALLSRLGWRRAETLRILERLSFLGALIEVFQSIPALHRDCDPLDWLADTFAIAVVLLLTHRFKRPA
ncbi:MAG: hypothetical protein KGN34_16295 [Sphingomonadales bacterium]|nr:hypothetical protein [Sphingomonadales bacterium]